MEIQVEPIGFPQSECKRRRISNPSSLPTLNRSDYYTIPSVTDLSILEFSNPGYCSKVPHFVIGRIGYGFLKFVSPTDVRFLDLDKIVKFDRNVVVVYENEDLKPAFGLGLNKPAEVMLNVCFKDLRNLNVREIELKLRRKTESQGAQFVSFDGVSCEWRFIVPHFSRFGLSDDEDEDIVMNEDKDLVFLDNGEDVGIVEVNRTPLSHSLPAHLGLDPVRMNDLRLLLLPNGEEDEVEESPMVSKELSRSPLRNLSQKGVYKMNGSHVRKTPLALLEYNPWSFTSSPPGGILMSQQSKGLHLNTGKHAGFELELKKETPVTGNHSCNVVDAALFMGRSFRVGWGPNGTFVHSGMPVGSSGANRVLSSVINLEKVAIDKVARNEKNEVVEELAELCFDAPLALHMELRKVESRNSELKLQKLVCDRLSLPDVCRNYIDIIEKQLEVPNLLPASRILLMHQVSVWDLIKVLFSSRKIGGQVKRSINVNDDEMMPEDMESYPDPDQEALLLMRRADFSYWLQDSVYHHVQYEISSFDESTHLERIFLLLTGRQLDGAVELAASTGDVRLSCLLSQAGGSTANRRDIVHQLDLWRKNGMDFSFIEDERVRLLELLAGNIRGALHGVEVDWKRFMGLLMWYQLSPDTPLPNIFDTYQKLLNEGNAPYPVPVYIDEGLNDWVTNGHFDLAYYLMLLHARQEKDIGAVKSMFSAFASTNDPLDYHMIWHHRAVLEAIGTFSSNDLHVLDMSFVSQLLSLGKCHWAIYVVLHMPHREDYPYLQTNVVREILFQYCEVWSKDELQWKFIEDLGVPFVWLNEALAVYYNYIGDLPKALHHFIECGNWQKAHSIFFTSVAHSLFLSAQHSEIWRVATSMENHRSEIEDWDLGAGIHISFYLLRNSLQEDSDTVTEHDTLENKNDACSDFIGRLNKSLTVWSGKLCVDARVHMLELCFIGFQLVFNIRCGFDTELCTRRWQRRLAVFFLQIVVMVTQASFSLDASTLFSEDRYQKINAPTICRMLLQCSLLILPRWLNSSPLKLSFYALLCY